MSGIPIEAHPLFDGIDLRRLINAGARLRSRTVPPGALVCGPQLRPEIVLVLRGRLQTFNVSRDGRQRLIFEVLGPGDVDGMLLTAGRPAHMCEAIARSEVVPISSSELDGLIRLSPRLALNLYAIAIGRIERREAHMAALSEHSSFRAVARQLLALADYSGTKDGTAVVILRPRPTHQQLADMLGLRRETVTLTLQRLRRLGAVGLRPCEMWVDRRRMAGLLELRDVGAESKRQTARIA